MQNYTIFVLLNWIYQRFLLIYVICLLGCFIHDMLDTMKNSTKINIKRIITSSFVCSMILSVLLDFDLENSKISISVYIAICFFIGMWSYNIIDYIMNWNFIKIFIKNILKTIKTNFTEALNDTMNEMDKEENEEDKKV